MPTLWNTCVRTELHRSRRLPVWLVHYHMQCLGSGSLGFEVIGWTWNIMLLNEVFYNRNAANNLHNARRHRVCWWVWCSGSVPSTQCCLSAPEDTNYWVFAGSTEALPIMCRM